MTLAKKVATLGPSTDALAPPDITKLLDSVDGVRINLAHASLEEAKSRLATVRRYERERGRPLAVIADLKGPSVRVGSVDPIEVRAGDRVVFKMADKSDGSYVPISARAFFQAAEPGDLLLMLDGKLKLRVTEAGPDYVKAVAESNGIVSSGKAVVIEGKDFDLPQPAEEDVEILQRLSAVREDLDYVTVSLAKSCKDVESVRSLLGELGYESLVAVKVESRGAVDDLENLVQCSDYIVIGRGDLGLHYKLELLPAVQRRIINTCLKYGKPVAVATQLLDSIQNSPIPTRAEVNDVYTTASMGVDSLWLTNETAVGKYPIDAVMWLSKILANVEYSFESRAEPRDVRDRFALGLVEMAEDLGASILVFSMTGTLARRIAKFRPRSVVYVGTPNIKVARRLAVIWALEPIHIPSESYEEGLEKLTALKGTPPYVATFGIRGGSHMIKVKFS